MGKKWLFFVFLIVAIYIFNLGMLLIKIPDSLVPLNKWVLMVGGVLIFVSGFKFLREYPSY